MMTQVVLGRTGLVVNKNGFGCLPIQRISREEAAGLLRCAYENGINFFDTARSYTDSEEKSRVCAARRTGKHCAGHQNSQQNAGRFLERP